MSFSDFAIFADESGTPVLTREPENYPVFVLAFLLVRKDAYAERLVPAVQRLKFDFVGHDQVVLHEREIRQQRGAFAFLRTSADLRATFLGRINTVIEEAPVTLVAAAIDKRALWDRHADRWSPYEIAATLCMEEAARVLREQGQEGREVHVVFEARGPAEDRTLELAFRRIANGEPPADLRLTHSPVLRWQPVFADKRTNSTGVQVADLMARPVGLGFLRSNQPNRALDIVRRKLSGSGVLTYP